MLEASSTFLALDGARAAAVSVPVDLAVWFAVGADDDLILAVVNVDVDGGAAAGMASLGARESKCLLSANLDSGAAAGVRPLGTAVTVLPRNAAFRPRANKAAS